MRIVFSICETRAGMNAHSEERGSGFTESGKGQSICENMMVRRRVREALMRGVYVLLIGVVGGWAIQGVLLLSCPIFLPLLHYHSSNKAKMAYDQVDNVPHYVTVLAVMICMVSSCRAQST